jgi:hypothetical protein
MNPVGAVYELGNKVMKCVNQAIFPSALTEEGWLRQ